MELTFLQLTLLKVPITDSVDYKYITPIRVLVEY